MRWVKWMMIGVLGATAACSPPTPEEVAEQAAADVEALLREAHGALRATNTWSSVDDAFRWVNSPSAYRHVVPELSVDDPNLAALKKSIRRVFTEANVLRREGNAVYFGLTGELLCSDGSFTPDSRCVSQVDQLELSVRASPGLDLAVVVGPEKLEPVVLRIRGQRSLEAELNLTDYYQAAEWVSTKLSQSSQEAFTVQGKGKLAFKLEKHGQHDFSVSASVLDAVSLSVTDSRGIVRSFTTAAASPLVRARIEGPGRVGTAELSFGRTEYRGIARDLFQADSTGPVVVSLAGLTGQLRVEDGKSQALNGFGFGDGQSYLQYEGKNIFSFDFNESEGRKVDLSWQRNTAGDLVFTTNRGIEAKTYFGLEQLPSDTGSIDPHLQNVRYTVKLSGSSGMTEVEAIRNTRFDGLRLKTGGLGLSSTEGNQVPRSFPQGTCLTVASRHSDSHPLLDFLQSVPCP